jgi:hypothetical protein
VISAATVQDREVTIRFVGGAIDLVVTLAILSWNFFLGLWLALPQGPEHTKLSRLQHGLLVVSQLLASDLVLVERHDL